MFFLFRAVFFSQMLIKAVLAKRVRCTVLYATETGKSLTFAKKLNTMLNRAFESRVRNAVFKKLFSNIVIIPDQYMNNNIYSCFLI